MTGRRSVPAALVVLAAAWAGGAPGRWQAAKEPGLAGRKDVLFFEGFEGGTSKLVNQGRRIVVDPRLAFDGNACMEVQHQKGTHNPYDVSVPLPPGDCYHLRFYVRFEEGFDWGLGHKGPGFYARAPGVGEGGAGVRPNGRDKFSCRVCFHPRGEPYFYYYHPDQKGPYGDEPGQNVGPPVRLVPGSWHCIEIMLKANAAGQKNGEVKMWIDGQLKGQYGGIRFRDTDDLRINSFNNSAYFGGVWTAPKDQKRWEDNYVVAAQYIGPMNPPPPRR